MTVRAIFADRHLGARRQPDKDTMLRPDISPGRPEALLNFQTGIQDFTSLPDTD